MPDRIQQTPDVVPCRLCLGKFGQHDWRVCPARCVDCNGYGHTLGANHPAGHIDSHQHMYHDILKEHACPTCVESGVLPRFQEEIKLYRKQLEELLKTRAVHQTE